MLRHAICEPDPWAGTGRRRVLVEGPDSWAWRPALVAAGYEVVTCRGPSPYEQCPLLLQGTCAAASGADEIVCELPSDVRDDIMDALEEQYPRVILRRSARELLH
jgi:hypothetical protein